MLSKLKRRLYKYLWLFRPLVYLFTLFLVVIILIWLAPKLKSAAKKAGKGPGVLVSILNPSITTLDSFKDRTNILLLGIGGGDHPGAQLTDSIMLISTNLLTGDTVLVSIPRDIWVESLKAKLNTAYIFGQQKQPQGGLTLAKAAVSEIINQPVHYVVLLDFSGFESAVDVIGGININVPHGFIDEKYPIPGKETVEPESDRYQTIEFQAGNGLMDGSTALKYIRSRNAEGEEGTDYARAQRQQRAILAFKSKFLSAKVLLNPKKLLELKKIFFNSVKTDIPSPSYPDFTKLALRINQDNIRTGILNQGSDLEDIPPLLYNPPISLYGQWVLLPVNSDWQSIFNYVEEILYQNQ